jgi:hypothetical protein
MRIASEHHALMALRAKLRAASDDVTPELMAEILEVSGRRFLLRAHGEQARCFNQLIEARAWVDVALVLLELELPLWHVRRIAYDGGEWHCALSRQRELPDWLDQSIEARHRNLALAILIAFVEAQPATEPLSDTGVPASFGRLDPDYIPLCCDNFD